MNRASFLRRALTAGVVVSAGGIDLLLVEPRRKLWPGASFSFYDVGVPMVTAVAIPQYLEVQPLLWPNDYAHYFNVPFTALMRSNWKREDLPPNAAIGGVSESTFYIAARA